MLQTTFFPNLSPRLQSGLPTLFVVLLETIDLSRRASGISALTALGLLFLGVALPTATAAQQLDSQTSSADATARDENGSVEKNDLPESALTLPFFQVDTDDPTGVTTLFAVRNTEARQITIDISYFGTDGAILHSDEALLAPRATHTVNLRDLPGLVADPDSIARGFAIVSASGGISGDFFQVDVGESFATGERMIPRLMCPGQELRFADFGDGTRLVVLLAEPKGLDPENDPPSFTVTAIDEAGNSSPPTEVYTDQYVYFTDAEDFTTQPFGTLFFNFATEGRLSRGGGWIYAVYSAGGRFSVGLGPTERPIRFLQCQRLNPPRSFTSAKAPTSADDSGTPPPEKVSRPESKWVLPFYQVDRTDPSGTTTLFAVRNTQSEAIELEIHYFPTDASRPVRTDTINLAADETHTVNVRDVPGLPADGDFFARGFATIETDRGQLTGDFFQVDVGGNFATGERLLSPRTDFCFEQEIRFADFGSGTELMLVLTHPLGADPNNDPVSVRVTPIAEDGTSLPSTEIHTDRFVYFTKASDFTNEAFGTLVFRFDPDGFQGLGWVYGVYSADGLFSVGVNSTGKEIGRGCDAVDFPQSP